jgi:endoglucanase
MKLLFLFSAIASVSLHAQELVQNGDLEKANAAGDWPDAWPKARTGGEYGKDGSNHFISLKSEVPGAMVMLYHEFKIPAGTKQLQLSWKQRITGLKRGSQPWFDARILLEFANAERAKMPGKPKAPNTGKDTVGWEEKSVTFDVPENAAFLQFMPSLFQVESGTFEIDDISLKVVDTPAQ